MNKAEKMGDVNIRANLSGIFNGSPNTHWVQLDTEDLPVIQTTAGPQQETLESALAHELGHVVTGTLDSGPKNMDNINQNENPVRTELNLPLRTSY